MKLSQASTHPGAAEGARPCQYQKTHLPAVVASAQGQVRAQRLQAAAATDLWPQGLLQVSFSSHVQASPASFPRTPYIHTHTHTHSQLYLLPPMANGLLV